ncbi:MAG: glycosyltransferase family 2 protein [Myxococcota bacterium]
MRAETVSIITVCQNAAETIGNTLQSVGGQTYADIQHIVIDGASTDGTRAVVERFGARVDEFVSEPDGGIYDALNKGLELASGELVGVLHADDFYADAGVIEGVVSAQREADSDCVYGDLIYVDRDDPGRTVRTWRAGELARSKLERGWIPPHPSFFASMEVCEAVGRYDTSLTLAADYDWMLTALYDLGASASYLPDTLVHMRTGGASNRSLSNRLRAHREDRRVMRRHGIAKGPLKPLLKPFSKIPQLVDCPDTDPIC